MAKNMPSSPGLRDSVKATGLTKRRLSIAVALLATSSFGQVVLADSGCPTGMAPSGNNLIVNGMFTDSFPETSIDAGQDIAGFTAGVPYHGVNSAPDDTGIALINTRSTTGGVTADGTFEGFVQSQLPFSGDSDNGVDASTAWLYSNGNNITGGAPYIYWQQNVSLEASTQYVFSAYYSNVITADSSNGTNGFNSATGLPADPVISVLLNNSAIAGPVTVYDHVDALSGDNGEDVWKRIDATFEATATDATFALENSNQAGWIGDDLATTAIGLYACESTGPAAAPLLGIGLSPVSVETVVGEPITQTITVDNIGDAELVLGQVVIDGLSEYSVLSDACSNTTLIAMANSIAASCDIIVEYSAVNVGSHVETLTVPSNASDGVVNLNGTTLAAAVGEMAISPASLAADGLVFGQMIVNSAADELSFTVENTAVTGDLTGLSIAAPTDAVFSITASTCDVVLLAGESCAVNVGFTPIEAIAYSASVVIESNEDTATVALSGTGVADLTDSDNDGLTDEIEALLGTDAHDTDTDDDGLLDGDEDTNQNGVYDAGTETNPLDVDTDDDGLNDGLEDSNKNGIFDEGTETDPRIVDTDGDGLTDGIEDADLDGNFAEEGETDPRIADTDGDGISDGVEDANQDGVYDVGIETDPLNVNTDGDANNDGVEDANGNGIIDGSETDPRTAEAVLAVIDERESGLVKTDLQGGLGAGGLPLLGLAGLGMWARRRKLSVAVSAILGSTVMVATSAHAEQGEIYIGLGGGSSVVKPDASESTDWVVDKDTDAGFKLFLGYDITDNISIEGFYGDLGASALLDTNNNAGEISYTAFGAELLGYMPNNLPGFSAFGKLGLSNISTESETVPFEDVEDLQVSAGVGLEYQFESGFGLRAEYQYFDEDAALLSISALKRFGKAPMPAPPVIDVIPEPEPEPEPIIIPPAPVPAPVIITPELPQDSDNDGVIDGLDKCPNTFAGIQVDGAGCAIDSDGDGVLNANDQCPNTLSGVQVDRTGCAVLDKFNGVLEGVNFYTNSDRLTEEAQSILTSVSTELLEYPNVRVIVVGHTDDQGNAAHNKDLSQRRARAVANFLVNHGVEASRMRYTGKGEEHPIASNTTENGRSRNRRVEFVAQEF